MKKYNLFVSDELGNNELVLENASMEKVVLYIHIKKADDELVTVGEVPVSAKKAEFIIYRAYDAEPALEIALMKKPTE